MLSNEESFLEALDEMFLDLVAYTTLYPDNCLGGMDPLLDELYEHEPYIIDIAHSIMSYGEKGNEEIREMALKYLCDNVVDRG